VRFVNVRFSDAARSRAGIGEAGQNPHPEQRRVQHARRCALKQLLNAAGGGEELLGAGADANVFGEIFPADGAGAVDEKFGGAGDVGAIGAAGVVEQIVAANDVEVSVGKKSERVMLRLAKMFGNRGRVHTDGDGANALRRELGKIVLNASQLEVTEGSPVAAIENEENGFGRLGYAARGREELRERRGLAGAVGESEIGSALADLRSACGGRDVASTVKERDGSGAQHRGKNRETRAEDLAAEELRLAKRADGRGQQEDQGENRKRESDKGEPGGGKVNKRQNIGEDSQQKQAQAEPESGVGAALLGVRHERQRSTAAGHRQRFGRPRRWLTDKTRRMVSGVTARCDQRHRAKKLPA